MYQPRIRTAQPRRHYAFGQYRATFYDQIVSEGRIGYEFVIAVFDNLSKEPVFFVTSERGAEEGVYFLCTFDEERHSNFGDSPKWADAAIFEPEALERISKRLMSKPQLLWEREQFGESHKV